jgi:hypothetical protein
VPVRRRLHISAGGRANADSIEHLPGERLLTPLSSLPPWKSFVGAGLHGIRFPIHLKERVSDFWRRAGKLRACRIRKFAPCLVPPSNCRSARLLLPRVTIRHRARESRCAAVSSRPSSPLRKKMSSGLNSAPEPRKNGTPPQPERALAGSGPPSLPPMPRAAAFERRKGARAAARPPLGPPLGHYRLRPLPHRLPRQTPRIAPPGSTPGSRGA